MRYEFRATLKQNAKNDQANNNIFLGMTFTTQAEHGLFQILTNSLAYKLHTQIFEPKYRLLAKYLVM